MVTPDIGTEKLPLHGVQGEMNRRVVLHQLGHFAGGIPDRPCVREARRVDVLVVRHIVEIVGDELPFETRGIDDEGEQSERQAEPDRTSRTGGTGRRGVPPCPLGPRLIPPRSGQEWLLRRCPTRRDPLKERRL